MSYDYTGFGAYFDRPNDQRRLPVARGYTIFQLSQLLADARGKLNEVQQALRPRYTEVQRLEEMIGYMLNNPIGFSMDVYVELRWLLAKAKMREDLQRIIARNRMEMACSAKSIGVDFAKAHDEVWSVGQWDPVRGRYDSIHVDRYGQRL